MLKYLSVVYQGSKRIDFDLDVVFDRNSPYPLYDKMVALVEQFVLCEYLSFGPNIHSLELTEYRKKIQLEFAKLPEEYTGTDQVIKDRYNFYKFVCNKVIYNGIASDPRVKGIWREYSLLENYDYILPLNFVENYIDFASGINSGVKKDAVLLVPSKPTHDVICFTAVQFEDLNMSKDFPHLSMYIGEATTPKFIASMNWKNISFITFLDIIQSFCVYTPNQMEVSSSIFALVYKMIRCEIPDIIDIKSTRIDLMNIFQYLKDKESMDFTTGKHSLKWVLESLRYNQAIVNYLMSKDPTTAEKKEFEKYQELSFLPSVVSKYGMEDVDSSEEDDSSDPDEDLSTTEEEADFDTDDGGSSDDDFGDDDFGDDDFGGDDFGDEGSSDDSGSDATQKPDNMQTPTDPMNPTIVIELSETASDFFFRNELVTKLTDIIYNPPKHLTIHQLNFLKIWLTEWIHLVPVKTTKDVLFKALGISINSL